MRVAIIGAGAGGLGVAWSLARAGVEVHVFDPGAAGAGATWASAGMLTPWQYDRPSALQHACMEAMVLWDGYRARLQAVTGIDIGYSVNGAIRVAVNEIEARALKVRAGRHVALGANAQTLDTPPHFLAPHIRLAVHYEGEGAVDNRALGPALARAVMASGGQIHEGERIVRVLIAQDKVLGVETPARRTACDVVVLAAGAWSGGIEGLPPGVKPPVAPRKGQIIALDSRGRCPFAGPLCAVKGYYAVPRANGHVVVGATLEDDGFSTQTGTEAVAALRAWLKDVIVEAVEWPVVEAWAGLRPGTPDDLPVLGPSKIAGLHFATGQFRDGILLTPWIADWVSAGIMTGRTPEPLKQFDVARFHKEPAR